MSDIDAAIPPTQSSDTESETEVARPEPNICFLEMLNFYRNYARLCQ